MWSPRNCTATSSGRSPSFSELTPLRRRRSVSVGLGAHFEHGDPARDQKWAACWMNAEGRLTAILTVDRQRDLVQARRVIEAGGAVDESRLADPAVTVKDAAI